jgi:hypothetical protein
VIHACIPTTREAETGGSGVQGQPGILTEILSQQINTTFPLKNQTNKMMRPYWRKLASIPKTDVLIKRTHTHTHRG